MIENFGFPKSIAPTGLTADCHGYLYCGLYKGGEILKIDPR